MNPEKRKFYLKNATIVGNTLDTEPHARMCVEAEECGDQYHTMHELYQHRMALNIALFNTLDNSSDYHNYGVYKSENHHPDSDKMFEGYFIVWCIDISNGNWTSYHYDIKHWDKFNIPTAVFSPLYPNNHISAIEFFSKMFGMPV